MVVFSAGIRPRDELGRAAGLDLGERGGIEIDDRCRTSDPAIYAIGECAAYNDRVYGLVAPGYHMARVAASALAGHGGETFTGYDMSTKLKLMGVDVASFGDAFATTHGAHVISVVDTLAEVYKKLVISADKQLLLGGVLVGDAANYGQLAQLAQNRIPLPPHPEDLLMPPREGGKSAGFGVDALPDAAQICSCNNVSKGQICSAIGEKKLTAVGAIKECTKAGTGCGSCVTLISEILHQGAEEGRRRGEQAPVRALRSLAPGAVSPGAPASHSQLRGSARAARHGPRLRDLQAGGGVDPGVGVERARPGPQAPAVCRTPTIASWPTSSATAPTRWCRASPAARSRPTS